MVLSAAGGSARADIAVSDISGTNHSEAQASESPGDFVHKLGITLKELKESRRWLRLIVKTQLVKETHRIEPLLSETEELIRILAASIRTARARKARK